MRNGSDTPIIRYFRSLSSLTPNKEKHTKSIGDTKVIQEAKAQISPLHTQTLIFVIAQQIEMFSVEAKYQIAAKRYIANDSSLVEILSAVLFEFLAGNPLEPPVET